jgi:hypothetical protein
MSIYLTLTRQFNAGRVRAMVCSGQAVVLYRLAIMSKDGDWILREDGETTRHVLQILSRYGTRYRFGAPLDIRWLKGGWSSHLQFQHEGLRVRTDFFTRPPRLTPADLEQQWTRQADSSTPLIGLRELAEMKKTNREKDYVVIGELARLMADAADQLLYSRSARDLMELAARQPELAAKLTPQRPLLALAHQGREDLETALDAERRSLIRANEARLERYRDASSDWARLWPEVEAAIHGLPLQEAHAVMAERAAGVLPPALTGDEDEHASG